MNDELKSAWEIALEKMEQGESTPVRTYTDEEKAEIADIRSRYQARIAETEIGAQSRIAQAAASGDPSQLDAVRQQVSMDKARLNREMENKVDQVRNRKSE